MAGKEDGTEYIVVNEHTLGYSIDRDPSMPFTVSVLAGNPFRGGANPKNGSITVLHLDQTRQATLNDLVKAFRVDPSGRLT
jgi:hypothetical protein